MTRQKRYSLPPSPLCIDSTDYGLDLTAPLSYSEPALAGPKVVDEKSKDVKALLSAKKKRMGYSVPALSLCALDLRPAHMIEPSPGCSKDFEDGDQYLKASLKRKREDGPSKSAHSSTPSTRSTCTKTESTLGCLKNSLDEHFVLRASWSYTTHREGYSKPVRSSCSVDLRPLPSSNDMWDFGTAIGSLCMEEDLPSRGIKRKLSNSHDFGPQRKRQKIHWADISHEFTGNQERGIKRKHLSDHDDNEFKRMKTSHRFNPRAFIMPCPSNCVCKVGPSQPVPKEYRNVEEPMVIGLLRRTHRRAARTRKTRCCEKWCFSS